jgi:anaerobic selenocysteine-containing dehydrogenase
VENICGTPKADFLKVCEVLASTSAADRTTTFLYALGWTQHTVGAQNIRTMAMIQLLLGNMGMAGGGVNALRGHSNIQGLNRFRPAVDQPAGLSDAAVGKTDRSANLSDGEYAKSDAAGSGELLEQLSEVLRQPDEIVLRRCGAETTGALTGCRSGIRLTTSSSIST